MTKVMMIAHHVNRTQAAHETLSQGAQRVPCRPSGAAVWIGIAVHPTPDAGPGRERLPRLETQALVHRYGHGLDHHLVEHGTRLT